MGRPLLPRPKSLGCSPPRQPRLRSMGHCLAQTIAKVVAREMAKAHVHYQAILNERSTATLQTSLKVSSEANGFKARLTLDAMEGDSEKTKISYFHHWINGEGMGHIESWKNSKTLIS